MRQATRYSDRLRACYEPDFRHGDLLKEETAPDTMFISSPVANVGQIECAGAGLAHAVIVESEEDTGLQARFAGPP